MDDRDREKFYVAPETSADDDDLELELEPPDTEADERRKRAALATIAARIDIDEVYREADRDRGGEIMENWLRNFRFRFQVKHLLIATAVIAIALTLAKFQLFWTALIVLVMLSVFALYAYIQKEEHKHQAEVDRKRDALYARRRAQQAAQISGHAVGSPAPPGEESPALSQQSDDHDEAELEEREKRTFRFQFSLRELLLTMTVAAVMLAMIRLFGGPAVTASVLGFFALIGLIVFALGFDPPQKVVLGWWLILVLYVVVSVFAATWNSMA